ncbi:MAG: alpha-glucosidase, partial [Sphingopyxis sp.]|nr:alpha-glucosidase [Sphingopyxis sp.]
MRISKGNPTVTMVRGNFRMGDTPIDVGPLPINRVSNDHVDLCNADGACRVRLSLSDDSDTYALSIMCDDPAIDRLSVQLRAEPDEHIWGGGEQMSYLSLRGRRFPMWTSEPGVGREPGTWLTD